VRLSRKLGKLFSLDAAESLWEHACRWTHPVSSRRILATIDRAELEKLRQHYPYRPNARRINAYEDAAYWIGVNVKHLQDLWLDRAPPLEILDLGCGAGYFLYLCRLFGHEGLGLDTDDEPFFRGTTKLLGVRREIARIKPERNSSSLPDIASVFTESPATKRACGRSGQLPIGNFSSMISGHGFSRRMGASCWNLIHDRTALHFSPTNCAPFFCRKARAFFVGKRCS
jgi:SAM-dependent methyltransferase